MIYIPNKNNKINIGLNEQKKSYKFENNNKLPNNFDINSPTSKNKRSENKINNDETCINESISNKYKTDETQIVSKKDIIEFHNFNILNKKFNFFYYRMYKITSDKKYKYFKNYEDFRTKVISVSEENIIKNHLYLFNLLKYNQICNINRIFFLEDLIKDMK